MDELLRWWMNASPGFVLVFMGAIAGLLLLVALRAQRRDQVEAGKTLLYKTTGGGRIGMWKLRGPFISLRVYEEFLVISALQTIVLPYSAIESVQIKKRFGLTEGVQIVHRDIHAPEMIVLGMTNSARIKEIIEAQVRGGK